MGRVFLLGLSGGSGSGKTTLAHAVVNSLGLERCALLTQDSYYVDQSARFDGDGGSVNFDHPESLDFDLLAQHLRALKAGRPVQVPIYDFTTHSRQPETRHLSPASIVVVDGTLLFSQALVVEALDTCVFVEAPESERFVRRLKRDVEERGRTPEGVERQFLRQVKPMHDLFIEPSRNQADLIVSGLESVEQSLARVIALLPR